MKRIKIVTRVHVYIFWWINFYSKENRGKKSISCKTRASTSCIPITRMCLCAKSWKKSRLSQESMFVFFDGWTLTLRKMEERKAFLWKSNINIVDPNEKNVFMMRNHENKITEIILRIHVCFFWHTNFDSKGNRGKESFSCKT